jgi:hypothetical protein
MLCTVAAMILAFAYRCGGSDGIAWSLSTSAPSSRLIPGLSSLGDTCRLELRVRYSCLEVNVDEFKVRGYKKTPPVRG